MWLDGEMVTGIGSGAGGRGFDSCCCSSFFFLRILTISAFLPKLPTWSPAHPDFTSLASGRCCVG